MTTTTIAASYWAPCGAWECETRVEIDCREGMNPYAGMSVQCPTCGLQGGVSHAAGCDAYSGWFVEWETADEE